jgi:integrase
MLGVATWTAIATGTRRGELCALRWTTFAPDRRVLHIRASIAHDGFGLVVKETKLGHDRESALDRDTAALLVAYRDHRRRQATDHGDELAPDGFIFSPVPDGSVCLAPASLGQRFHRLVASLGIQTTLHKLRHYNATELILANIDLRTVAGRLGHLDASTTLTTYTAWINEANQRASTQLVERLPLRLAVAPHHRHPAPPPQTRSISSHIAEELRAAIIHRTYKPGHHLPAIHVLVAHYRVSASTIHRAITQLAHWNLVTTTPGHPTTVHPNPPTSIPEPTSTIPPLTPTQAPIQASHQWIHRHHTRRSQRQPHVAGNTRAGHRLSGALPNLRPEPMAMRMGPDVFYFSDNDQREAVAAARAHVARTSSSSPAVP